MCVDVDSAILSISQEGEVKLAQRTTNVEVDYYTRGVRNGKIESIGNVPFAYYTSRNYSGKVEQIGDLRFEYYTSRGNVGKLRFIGDIEVDYYSTGSNRGRVEQIGRVSFDYDDDNRIRTRGTLEDVNLLIVDLINPVNPE